MLESLQISESNMQIGRPYTTEEKRELLQKMRQTLVRDLMTRDVAFIREDVSILDAVWKMQEYDVSSLVVKPLNRGDWFGIVTQKDLIHKLIDPGPGEQHVLVADVMTRPVVTVPPAITVGACVKLMKRLNIRRMPVSDGTEIIGILSDSDIFKKFYPGPAVD